jgi:hypothetical protein
VSVPAPVWGLSNRAYRRPLPVAKANFVIAITETRTRSATLTVGQYGIAVMLRYVAFLAFGSAFVASIVITVQTHRLATEPKILLTNAVVNYVAAHWPPTVPATSGEAITR